MSLLLLLACAVKTSVDCVPVPGQGDCPSSEPVDSSGPDSPVDSEPPVDTAPEVYAAELVGKGRYYQTIQEAIFNADDGDVVLVQPGTWYERIDFHGKGVHILSEAGPSATVLNGQETGSVVEMRAMEPETAILEGFTITGGEGTMNHGGGVFVENADGVIQHNIIEYNRAGIGGGVYLRHGSATVRNNIIRYNDAREGGGGVTCTNCKGRVEFNTFYENTCKNGALGEWFYEPQGDLVGNVVVFAEKPDFAIRFMDPKGYTHEVAYNLLYPETLWVNPGEPWAAEYPEDVGTLYVEPLLVDPENGDFTLQPDSPAIDSGPPEFLDADGSPSDRGAFGGPHGDWSP